VGQRQRIAIAWALLAEPKVLLCDEVLSALDVSVQARIIDLRVRAARRMAMLFISHDLAEVRRLSDRVAGMQAGRIVETGPTETIFARPTRPLHPIPAGGDPALAKGGMSLVSARVPRSCAGVSRRRRMP